MPHEEAIRMIGRCESLYDLRLLMHSHGDLLLCFSVEQELELEAAVNAQILLISAKQLIHALP
jgi:esterase/lipase superfamily enzyme